MGQAIRLSKRASRTSRSAPIGAVVVLRGRIIGRGFSQVGSAVDPTAHAEIVAIRDAAKRIGSPNLKGATLYTNVAPCPMCLSACQWANIGKVYYAVDTKEAASLGFPDLAMFNDLRKAPNERAMEVKPLRSQNKRARKVMDSWFAKAKNRRVFDRLNALESIDALTPVR